MKVLVTGGGGFLGSHILEALLARGDTVRSFGRGIYPELDMMSVEHVRGDLRDAQAVGEAVRGMDAVLHVAALAGMWGPWKHYFGINVEGTRNVIGACRRHGVDRLVYTSTPSVAIDGKHSGLYNESAPYVSNPLSHYATTKAMAEREVLAADGGSLRTVALRPHLIWGPRDRHLMPRLCARARAGKLLRIGDGRNLVDPCYVTNAVDAHLLALDALTPDAAIRGKAYFVSDGEPVSLWDWIDELLTRMNIPRPRRAISATAAYRLGAAMEAVHTALPFLGEPKLTRFVVMQMSTSHSFDLARIRKDLGYEPRVKRAEGMEKLLATWQYHEGQDFF